jgi:hypothetical protein
MQTAPTIRLNRVGLFGPPKAGKTTLAAVVGRALRDRNWKVELYSSDDHAQTCGRSINEISRQINRGYFPRKTEVAEQSDSLAFRISKRQYAAALEFRDPAGELFEATPNSHLLQKERECVFDSIKDCTGILILLDWRKSATELEEAWRLSIESFMEFIRRRQLTGLLDNDSLKLRIAVLFTKADLIPWFQLHRPREADSWLEKHKGLASLMHDVHRMCGPDRVRFGFSSNLGWNYGRPNCRTALLPTRLDVEQHRDQQEIEPRDLIPDHDSPGVSRESRGTALSRRYMLPLFVDPMRIVNQEDVDWDFLGIEAGLVSMPGRMAPATDSDKFLTPWNVVEPLLWAAGVPESEF